MLVTSYQLIRLRISFICSPRRGRTVARIDTGSSYINILPPKQVPWCMSRDAKFSSSPPTVPHLRGTRTVHGDRTSSVARSTSRTGKCSRSVVLMQSRNRARRSMRAASVGSAHPRPPGDVNASAQSPTSGARAGALGCGGRELMRRGARQLKAADDLAEPGQSGRRSWSGRGRS